MEASPLTQDTRPEVFEPKIVKLYLQAFSAEEDALLSEGFWRELFLLHPDKKRLLEILRPFTADDLLQIQTQTRMFFRRAVVEAGSGVSSTSENALENLTAFLSGVLTKRYTNPSTDIIEVLAGLTEVDKLMTDLVNGLDITIRTSNRTTHRNKAVKTALAMVSGGYQTTLGSYFTHRDLFPGLMQYANETSENDFLAFVLLGILANLSKFEIHNIYQNRLEDFVNEPTIQRLVRHVGTEYRAIRDGYVAVQDDIPETWTESTLGFVGFKGWTSHIKPPLSDDVLKDLLSVLPYPSAAVSLLTYSFASANKLFASDLVSCPSSNGSEAPFSSFLSATSYLTHNAHRSQRALSYTILNLLSIQILAEDSVIVKRLCSTDLKLTIRLCRQRPPQLPFVSGSRMPATAIMDIGVDTLSHNLRRRLDVPLYALALGIMLRLISHLVQAKVRIEYHWKFLWASLLSAMRFLVQYSTDVDHLPKIRQDVCLPLASLLVFCLSQADSFLPDPSSYDDLFYKILEAHEVLLKFRTIFCDLNSIVTNKLNRASQALVAVSSHYHDLLRSRGKKHQSPAEVQQVIKEGHETLNMGPNGHDDFGHFEPWREASRKPELKKIIRTVIEDARQLSER